MKLNEQTTIPIWAMAVSLPTIIGAILWLSSVANLGQATAKTVDRLEMAVYKIQEDVAFIRGQMEKTNKQSKEDE